MTDLAPKEFTRGINNKRALERAESFFSSSLGKKLLSGRADGYNPFQICIRNNYFNIYWNGCSVLNFRPNATKNTYTIHDKYVHGKNGSSSYLALDPREEMVVNDLTTSTCKGWSFFNNIIEPLIKGENVSLLDEYASKGTDDNPTEKSLLKSYLESDDRPFLMDLEVAFSRIGQSKAGNPKPVADRIDMAEVVYDDNNTPILKLVEVKASDDSRLRANDLNVLTEHPKKIVYQMNLYQNFIDTEESRIEMSYRVVAKNMLKFGFDKFMRGLGDKSATEVLNDFAERGIVDSRPHLLVLAEKEDGYVKDQHFETLQRIMRERQWQLRTVLVNQG